MRLASLGFDADFDEIEPTGLRRTLLASIPDAYLIDLSRLPSHGREVGMWLRINKDTRHVPLLFVDGDPAKVAQLETLLPDATYTTWGRLKTAIARAIARPPAAPIVPPSSIYSGKPAVEKLGVKAGMKVCVIGAPKGFTQQLTPLPSKVTFTASPSAACDLFLVVVRSERELVLHLGKLSGDVARQTVWAIWPKKASNVKSDLNGNVVRERGLALGWVDFKICAIDDTWSGLAFKRRDSRARSRGVRSR